MSRIIIHAIIFLFLVSCNNKKTSKNFTTSKQNIVKEDSIETLGYTIPIGKTDAITLLHSVKISQPDENILYFYKRLPPYFLCQNSIDVNEILEKEIYRGEIVEDEFYDKKIIYKNIRNGYLKIVRGECLHSSNNEKSNNPLELALFRSSNNKKIILLNDMSNKTMSMLYLTKKDTVTKVKYWKGEVFPFSVNDYFFKLPEYGTTILAYADKKDSLENPSKFWEDKIKNHSEEIIRIEWDMKKGVFYIKK